MKSLNIIITDNKIKKIKNLINEVNKILIAETNLLNNVMKIMKQLNLKKLKTKQLMLAKKLMLKTLNLKDIIFKN